MRLVNFNVVRVCRSLVAVIVFLLLSLFLFAEVALSTSAPRWQISELRPVCHGNHPQEATLKAISSCRNNRAGHQAYFSHRR